MDIRELDRADEPAVRRLWEIGRAVEAERPYDFSTPWAQFWQGITEGREDRERLLLGAYEGDTMWASATIELNLLDNLHMASAAYGTHPDRRRRGLGRALAEASFELVRRHGRTVLVTEAFAPHGETSPGLLFGEAMGFTRAIEDGMKVVDLVETEPLWDELAARAAARHEDYRLVTWHDRMPDELVESYCRLNQTFFDEAPTGELPVEQERWDVARVRAREGRNARQGKHEVTTVALAPDGAVVGLTEVVVVDSTPTRGFQSGTLVSPAHRGHSLGMAIKVANHRQLRERFPECRVLLTGNADVNVAMNAVNEALGYREVERCVEMQRPL